MPATKYATNLELDIHSQMREEALVEKQSQVWRPWGSCEKAESSRTSEWVDLELRQTKNLFRLHFHFRSGSLTLRMCVCILVYVYGWKTTDCDFKLSPVKNFTLSAADIFRVRASVDWLKSNMCPWMWHSQLWVQTPDQIRGSEEEEEWERTLFKLFSVF